jgi:hypothetical protein
MKQIIYYKKQGTQMLHQHQQLKKRVEELKEQEKKNDEALSQRADNQERFGAQT